MIDKLPNFEVMEVNCMVNGVVIVRDEVWPLCITTEGGFRAYAFDTGVATEIAVKALSL